MKRQITIYESAQNGKITVFNDVECNTLSELKALLREKGINYRDMEFIEGVTNTKLLSDDSRIPTDIPFKGKKTNNVFINILKKESKISSGVSLSELSRSELLKVAKEYSAEITSTFKRNFTQVSSSSLIAFLEEKGYVDNSIKDEDEEYEDEENENEYDVCEECEEIPLVDAIVTMIRTLKCEDAVVEALTGEEKEENEDTAKSVFSSEDIRSFINR